MKMIMKYLKMEQIIFTNYCRLKLKDEISLLVTVSTKVSGLK